MPRPLPGFRVFLPGADDVYDLVPDRALSPAERQRRREERRARIEASPTPEIVRDIQYILQRIDDVQDGLVTLSLITRFAVPMIPALAPFARSVATVADVLNIGRIMQNLGLVGGSWKASLFRHLATQPGTYSSRLRATLRTSRVNPTVGELLQVLQTTDILFGVGMQLGAVMGLPVDLLSLAIRGGTLDVTAEGLAILATLAPVFLSASPWLKLAGLAGGFALAALALGPGISYSIPFPGILPADRELAQYVEGAPDWISTLTALETADQVLTDTSYLDGLGQELHPRDHAMLELARYQALSLLVIPAMATPGGILQPESHPPVTFPVPLPRRPLAWLSENRTDPRAIAIASLVGQAWHALALALEPPDALESPTWSGHALAVAQAVEHGHAIPEGLL